MSQLTHAIAAIPLSSSSVLSSSLSSSAEPVQLHCHSQRSSRHHQNRKSSQARGGLRNFMSGNYSQPSLQQEQQEQQHQQYQLAQQYQHHHRLNSVDLSGVDEASITTAQQLLDQLTDEEFDVEQLSSLCLGGATPSTVAESVASPADQQQYLGNEVNNDNNNNNYLDALKDLLVVNIGQRDNGAFIKLEDEQSGGSSYASYSTPQMDQSLSTPGTPSGMDDCAVVSSSTTTTTTTPISHGHQSTTSSGAAVFGPARPPGLGGMSMQLQQLQPHLSPQPGMQLNLPAMSVSSTFQSLQQQQQQSLTSLFYDPQQQQQQPQQHQQQLSLQSYDIPQSFYNQQQFESEGGKLGSIRPRTTSTLQTVLESNTKRVCFGGETTTTTTTLAKTEEILIEPSMLENRFSTLEFEGGTISARGHLNVENCYSYAWRRWSKTDAPSVRNRAGTVQVPHTMAKDDEQRNFQYILGSPTSAGTKIGDMPMTYLNQGQSYEIRLKKLKKGAVEPNLKTMIRVGFVEKRLQYREEQEMAAWSVLHEKDRLLDIDFTMSYGVFDINENAVFNHCIQFLWNPCREASIFVKVNCISTEFTSKRHGGERGAPLRLVAETFSMDGMLLDSGMCYIKVFKSKGAERKHKTDRDRVSKHPEAELVYLPSYDCTLFSSIKDDDGGSSRMDTSSPSLSNTSRDSPVFSGGLPAIALGASLFAPSRGNEDLKAVAAIAAAHVKSRQLQHKQQQQLALQYGQPMSPATPRAPPTPTTPGAPQSIKNESPLSAISSPMSATGQGDISITSSTQQPMQQQQPQQQLTYGGDQRISTPGTPSSSQMPQSSASQFDDSLNLHTSSSNAFSPLDDSLNFDQSQQQSTSYHQMDTHQQQQSQQYLEDQPEQPQQQPQQQHSMQPPMEHQQPQMQHSQHQQLQGHQSQQHGMHPNMPTMSAPSTPISATLQTMQYTQQPPMQHQHPMQQPMHYPQRYPIQYPQRHPVQYPQQHSVQQPPPSTSGMSPLATPPLGSPQSGSPQMGSPQLGSPQMSGSQPGSPQIGSPQLRNTSMGSPRIGSSVPCGLAGKVAAPKYLPEDADPRTTTNWLLANRFQRVIPFLKEYNAEELRDLSREELISILHTRDAIRLYNRLHKNKGAKLTLYISRSETEHHALYLNPLTLDNLRSKLLEMFDDPTIHIREMHVLGPRGIRVRITDEVVENMMHESIFDCDMLGVGEEYDILLKPPTSISINPLCELPAPKP